MKYFWIKHIFIIGSILFLSCSKSGQEYAYNIYGNSHRTSSYESLGRFWTGVALLEKVNISDTTGFVSIPLSLKGNVFVTSTSNGYVVLFENTDLLWEVKLEPDEYVISNLVASPKQEIIFITNHRNIYSISNSGQIIWKIQIPEKASFFSTLLATNDGVFFTDSNSILYKVDYSGKIVWTKKLPLPSTNCFAEMSNSILAVIVTNDSLGATDTLLVLDKSGETKWKKFFDGIRLVRTPIVWNERIYLIGYKENRGEIVGLLICLDDKGKLLWTKEFGIVPRYISISNAGEIYLILYNSGLGETMSTIYKIDSTGKILNLQHISAIFYSPLFISEQILGAVGYSKGLPMMIFFGTDLNIWKSIDLSKFPSVLNIPAFLENRTLIFVSTSGNYFIKIDENPIIKMLPW